MKKIFAVCCAVTLLFSGCTGREIVEAEELTASFVAAEVQIGQAETEKLNEFAVDLFKHVLSEEDENPVISPVSAYLALGMAAMGAESDTLREFESLLGNDIGANCRALIAALKNVSGDTVLNVADSAWVDSEAEIYDEFLQDIVDYFNAQVFTQELSSDDAREAVNAWISDKTEGLIPEMNEENFKDDVILVLINTIYMMAKWQSPFESYNTNERKFATESGEIVTADFLNSYYSSKDYIKTEDAEGIVLPYSDGKTTFLALRPTDGSTIREFAVSLKGESLAEYVAAAENTVINFSMPKFEVEYGAELNDYLVDMGLISAFDMTTADFSRMGKSERGNIHISEVMQKVKIIVDEEGTQAAAATQVATADSAAPLQEPQELILDSPFIYAVIELDTGMPLFLGLLSSPT